MWLFLVARYENRSIRSFSATLGPTGGRRGYAGITAHVSNGLAWYMNGLLIPELWLRRGLTYSFKVRISIICTHKMELLETTLRFVLSFF